MKIFISSDIEGTAGIVDWKETELSERVGITLANLSILKNGRAKAVRVETLNKLCAALDCQPGDLMAYQPGEPE